MDDLAITRLVRRLDDLIDLAERQVRALDLLVERLAGWIGSVCQHPETQRTDFSRRGIMEWQCDPLKGGCGFRVRQESQFGSDCQHPEAQRTDFSGMGIVEWHCDPLKGGCGFRCRQESAS